MSQSPETRFASAELSATVVLSPGIAVAFSLLARVVPAGAMMIGFATGQHAALPPPGSAAGEAAAVGAAFMSAPAGPSPRYGCRVLHPVTLGRQA